jgi:Tfp pilus assembly protein FimT
VIAIIAVLAAIVFPVFAQAREKDRQASYLSNVKQMSTAGTYSSRGRARARMVAPRRDPTSPELNRALAGC